MEPRQAIQIAKQNILDLFSGEAIDDVALEEIKFDDVTNRWQVTIGFHRPWDLNYRLRGQSPLSRTYKIVEIEDASGKPVAVRNYESPVLDRH